MISIVMPVYNSERFLHETICSILKQSYEEWELIAVDDCSSDESYHILKQYARNDKRIVCIRNEKNLGPAESRNKGIKLAQGRYLAFMDSDDIWKENRLQVTFDFMKEKKCAFVFSGYDLIGENGENLYVRVEVPAILTYRESIYKTIISTITVLLDLEQTGKIEMPDIGNAEDSATWTRIIKKIGRAYGINECLASYRQVKGSVSHNVKGRITRPWKRYREIEGFSIFESCYYYIRYVFFVIGKRKRVKHKDENMSCNKCA